MLRKLYPTRWEDSVYCIDFEELYANGARGLIFDIDNTLVPHGAPADERAKKLFAHLRQIGLDACLLSNNQEPRVKSFNDEIGVHYIYNAHKPSGGGYRDAMQQMHTDISSTWFIGDQIFTDILGANLAQIPSVLVNPIHPKEEIQIVLKRYLEKIVLFFYKKHIKKKRKEVR